MGKKKFQYKKAEKQIRKYTRFDYKGIPEKKLSSGQKAAIRRAFNDIEHARRRGAKLVTIPRKPKESDRSYRRRIQAIHRNTGQSGQAFKAVALKEITENDSVSFKGNTVTLINKNTGQIRSFIDSDALATVLDPRAEARRVWREAKKRGATGVSFMHGFTKSFDEYEDEESFADAVAEIINAYPSAIRGKKAEAVFASFLATKAGKSKKRKRASNGKKAKKVRRRRL